MGEVTGKGCASREKLYYEHCENHEMEERIIITKKFLLAIIHYNWDVSVHQHKHTAYQNSRISLDFFLCSLFYDVKIFLLILNLD